MTVVVTAAGYVLAALCLGLAWGERQRRLDAFQRLAVPPRTAPSARTVAQPVAPFPTAPPHVREALADAKKQYIQTAIAEGYSPKAAEADWEEMMALSATDQLGVLPET